MIPAIVRKFGSSAFRDCSSLTQVTIPADVAEFKNNNAFWGVTIANLTLVGSSVSAALRDARRTTSRQMPSPAPAGSSASSRADFKSSPRERRESTARALDAK
jgi:hypothetical protein